jgi:hypothetical protein
MWAAVEVTMAATRTRDLIQGQLRSHMPTWNMGTLLRLQYICNTLTPLQLVELVTSSYPFIPRFGESKFSSSSTISVSDSTFSRALLLTCTGAELGYLSKS